MIIDLGGELIIKVVMIFSFGERTNLLPKVIFALFRAKKV
jgi:hypothetical protein